VSLAGLSPCLNIIIEALRLAGLEGVFMLSQYVVKNKRSLLSSGLA